MEDLACIAKPFDIDGFLAVQDNVSRNTSYKSACLGMIDEYPIKLLFPEQVDKSKPSVLIAGGFHGEEPAGCWGILKFMQMEKESLTKWANISFLPLVNPTGFAVGCRYNRYGENPCLGFCPPSTDPLSREGQILVKNIDLLVSLARDCFITLHEECSKKNHFYLFSFENSKVPGRFTQILLEAGGSRFKIIEDCEIGGSIIRNGIVFNEHDGTFEDLMFRKGVSKCACTETPGQGDINKRVETNRLIIQSVMSYFV